MLDDTEHAEAALVMLAANGNHVATSFTSAVLDFSCDASIPIVNTTVTAGVVVVRWLLIELLMLL